MTKPLMHFAKYSTVATTLVMLLLGPFQPLIAQAQTTGDTFQARFDASTAGTPSTQSLVQTSLNNPGALPSSGSSPFDISAGLQANSIVNNLGNTTGATGGTGGGTTPSTPGGSTAATGSNDIGCNFSGIIFGNTGGTFGICITNIVYVFTVGIGSGFAYVSAYFFDLAVQISLNSTAYALSFITGGWTTARDLANMAFLFILIYIAFMVMLEAETSGTLQTLAWVVIIALMVNFSFFFTRIVIDAGNILSIQFYNAINAPPISVAASSGSYTNPTGYVVGAVNGVTGNSQTKDLTASIMGMLQITNLFNTTSFQTWFTGGGGRTAAGFLETTISLSFLYIAAGIMFWLLTVAFVTNGIKFLFRIVVLWFLIIASPLAFVAYVIPGFKSYYSKWQGLLIEHAFYPVAFMFIFLILVNFANQMGQNNNLINGIFNGLQGASSGSAVAAIGYAAANVGIRLGFVIAMLYIGLEAAGRIGVMGSSTAEKAGDWVSGKFRASTVGFASRAGGIAYRATIAKGAQNNIDYFEKNPPKTRLGQYFDYAWRKNVLAPIAGASVGGAQTLADRQKVAKARAEDLAKNRRGVDRAETVKAVGAKLDAGKTIAPDEKNAIQRITKKELEDMKGSDLKSIAVVLSEDQVKKIGDIEKLSEKDREEIRDKWEEKSEESPVRKSLKKLDDIRKSNADAANEIANLKSTPNATVDGTWAGKLRNILQKEHGENSTAYDGKNTDFRDARRDLTAAARKLKTATDALNAGPPTAAIHAAVATAQAEHATQETRFNAAKAEVNAAHAARQKSQETLDAFKEFDDNRKKVEPNTNINGNGVKGTFKATFLP